jgi:hypothetical protein
MNNTLYKLTNPIRNAGTVEFRKDNPGVFLVKEADLREYGYAWGNVDPTPPVSENQELRLGDPILQGAFVTQGWIVSDNLS